MLYEESDRTFSFECPENVMFECNRCALCCGDTEDRVRNIRLLKVEADRIARETAMEISDFADRLGEPGPYTHKMRKQDGKCIFLKDGLCRVYSSRPLTCRFYPFELREIDNGRQVFSFTDECPCIGIGKRLTRQHFDTLFRESLATFEKNDRP